VLSFEVIVCLNKVFIIILNSDLPQFIFGLAPELFLATEKTRLSDAFFPWDNVLKVNTGQTHEDEGKDKLGKARTHVVVSV
jgi:hypothetical protein